MSQIKQSIDIEPRPTESERENFLDTPLRLADSRMSRATHNTRERLRHLSNMNRTTL